MTEKRFTFLERFSSAFKCRRREGFSLRENYILFACYLSGVFKGIALAPIVVPVFLVSTVVINLMSLPLWLDHGFATLYYTRLFGRNIKFPLVPVLLLTILLHFVLTICLSVPFALAFVLVYPGFSTYQIKQQSAWRHAYIWAGWSDTMSVAGQNVQQYYLFSTLGIRDALRTIRRKSYAFQYEIHPLNVIVSFFTLLFGSLFLVLSTVLLLAVKIVPMLIRAFSNHVSTSGDWFRTPLLILAWLGMWIGIPTIGALSIPFVICYSIYHGYLAALLPLKHNGDLYRPSAHLIDAFVRLHRDTSKYIFNQDVPFVILPAGKPLAPLWLIAGILPFLASLVVTAVVFGLICVTSIFMVYPVLFDKIFTAMGRQSRTRPHLVPLFGLMLIFSLAVGPLGVMGVFVLSLLSTLRAILVTHSTRSLVEGFRYALGNSYIYEYKINKFLFAVDENQQVHAMSVLPHSWALMARPYMNPKEWETLQSDLAQSIVSKSARFVPPGLRRPKIDAQGSIIDVSGPAYDVPGVGITLLAPDGSLSPPLPQLYPLTTSNTPTIHTQLQLQQDSPSAEPHLVPVEVPVAAPRAQPYGLEILPLAYRIALAEVACASPSLLDNYGRVIVPQNIPIPESVALRVPSVVAGLAGSPGERDVAAQVLISLGLLPEDVNALSALLVGVSQFNGRLPTDASSANYAQNAYSAIRTGKNASFSSQAVAQVNSAENEPFCMCFRGMNDGYEEDDAGFQGGSGPAAVSTATAVPVGPNDVALELGTEKPSESAASSTSTKKELGSSLSRALFKETIYTPDQMAQLASVAQRRQERLAAHKQTGVVDNTNEHADEAEQVNSAESSSPNSSDTSKNPSKDTTKESSKDARVPSEEEQKREAEVAARADSALAAAMEAVTAAHVSTAAARSVREAVSTSASKVGTTPLGSPSRALKETLSPAHATKSAAYGEPERVQMHRYNDSDDEEEEEEDEEVFVLQPVVNSLPDEWVELPAPGGEEGEVYYVNYARNQSSWSVPAGWAGPVVMKGSNTLVRKNQIST